MNKIVPGIIFEDDILNDNNVVTYSRGTLIEVHIADVHFGAFDPKEQYKILKEQFLDKIRNLKFDIISINGDLFDRKTMSNSDVVMYGCLFIDEIVQICKSNGATLVLIHGTRSHDASQLKLFYHYLNDPDIDIRIIEETKFEYIKGAKILCIPEEYGRSEDYYVNFLYRQGPYDGVFMHGNIYGAIYSQESPELGSEKAPIFKVNDFSLSRGPIISGHVHVAGCYEKYAYYCGSPYRWAHGEEQPKGFYIVLRNLDNNTHYTHFEEIFSHKYITINIDELLLGDPKEAISFIQEQQKNNSIDFVRLQFKDELNDNSSTNLQLIKNYFRTNTSVKFNHKKPKKKVDISTETVQNEVMEKYKQYEYIVDPSLTEYEIFVRYVNDMKGTDFITVDELTKILSEI